MIADRYLFNKTNAVFDKNIISLLGLFSGLNQKINIVFFTESSNEKYRQYVSNKIKGKLGQNTNITFVEYNNENPHDRYILTNYRLFISGDSLNYFDESGSKTTKGLFLEVYSSAAGTIPSVIDEIRTIYQTICNLNRNRIYGDKRSNFICFAQ